MPFTDSDTHIFCQKCGAKWLKNDNRAMERFRPQPDAPKWASPLSISLSGQPMTECPKDEIPIIDESMTSGDDRKKAGDETDPRRPADQHGGTEVTTFADEA